MIPYQPRPIASGGRIAFGDWAIKSYSIVYGDRTFDAARFVDGRQMALAALPEPAVTASRLGVGFLIEHQGRNVDYVVLAWWDRENELPLRVFVHDPADGEGWRAARGNESICVWDLEVIWAERAAYVATVLGAQADDARAAYLSAEWGVGSGECGVCEQ